MRVMILLAVLMLAGPPAWAAPEGRKKLTNISTPPMKKHQKLAMFTRGKAMSGAPICNGMK